MNAPRVAWSLALIAAMIAGCDGQTTTTTSQTTTVGSAPTTSTSVTPLTGPDAALSWIAFQSPEGLRLIRPDGQESISALPDGPAEALHPDWSSDGQRLAFVVDEADGTRDIWVANWDGSDAARLVNCHVPCRDADSPAWSPDRTKIAFNRIDNVDGHNPGSKIQTVDVATGEITTIVATEGAEYAGGQRWSPDGRSLVVEIVRFIDDGNDTTEITGKTIAVVDMMAATVTLRLLRPFDSYSTYPDWHPTQDLILFAAGPSDPLDPILPPQNLFTIRPDGSGLTQITNQGLADDGLWMPAFRFDNDGILATLVHRPNGNLTLVELQPDGSEISALGDSGDIPGAHPRQRPTPALP